MRLTEVLEKAKAGRTERDERITRIFFLTLAVILLGVFVLSRWGQIGEVLREEVMPRFAGLLGISGDNGVLYQVGDSGAEGLAESDSGNDDGKAVSTEKEMKEALFIDERATEAVFSSGEGISGRNVYFAGIEDAVLYGEGRIALENLKENEDFLMRYRITEKESGKEVFSTGLIPSGQRVYFEPYEVLGPGVYSLLFEEVPYAVINEEYVALTSGSNEVRLELR